MREHVGQPLGRQADFDEFVLAYQNDLFRFCTSLTGSQHDAWDLLQDGFARLLVAWTRMDLNRDPLAYARQTMTRLYLNKIRSAKREMAAIVRLRGPFAISDLPESTFEPWLEESYQGLAPRQRASIALVHIWGFSVRETAETLQCRENTVKTHLARGMAHLRGAATAAGKEANHGQSG